MAVPNPGNGLVLVTGAEGHIGREVCRLLRAGDREILPVDLLPAPGVVACDLRRKDALTQLFEAERISAVLHLAGILPSAFRSDPLGSAEVNLSGSIELLRQAVHRNVKRFVFASSMSVYGSAPSAYPLTETDPAIPDEVYGGAKRAIELLGEAAAQRGEIEFVALRIARVIGPGVRKSSSPWRSHIFEPLPGLEAIRIPFAPNACLSLVHVEDVARMLQVLLDSDLDRPAYNTPAEQWDAKGLKELVENTRGIRVELGPCGAHGGPTCDGSRFERKFGFELHGLRERLADQAHA